MEFLEGGTLKQFIKNNPEISEILFPSNLNSFKFLHSENISDIFFTFPVLNLSDNFKLHKFSHRHKNPDISFALEVLKWEISICFNNFKAFVH